MSYISALFYLLHMIFSVMVITATITSFVPIVYGIDDTGDSGNQYNIFIP